MEKLQSFVSRHLVELARRQVRTNLLILFRVSFKKDYIAIVGHFLSDF